jgi:hypothetical protein
MVYYKRILLLTIFCLVTSSLLLGQKAQVQQPISENPILSKDYWTAKRALDESIQKEDSQDIRLGLKSSFVELKIESVEAMKKLNCEDFLLDLVETLKNNRVELRGTELQVLQRELDKTIILALEKITGLYLLPLGKELMESDIENAIENCQKWWKSRHNN